MKKLLVAVLVVLALSLATVAPAFAIVHPFVPTELPGDGGGGQAVQNGGIGHPGGDPNPGGVSAPVPTNNPGKGSPSP